MASGTLCERFRVDSDLHSDALVVHIGWLGKELTECRASGIVNHNVDGSGRRLRVSGRVCCPSWAVVKCEPCGGSSADQFLEEFGSTLGAARGIASDWYIEKSDFLYGATARVKDVIGVKFF